MLPMSSKKLFSPLFSGSICVCVAQMPSALGDVSWLVGWLVCFYQLIKSALIEATGVIVNTRKSRKNGFAVEWASVYSI